MVSEGSHSWRLGSVLANGTVELGSAAEAVEDEGSSDASDREAEIPAEDTMDDGKEETVSTAEAEDTAKEAAGAE